MDFILILANVALVAVTVFALALAREVWVTSEHHQRKVRNRALRATHAGAGIY